jgi:hypothetical protein
MIALLLACGSQSPDTADRQPATLPVDTTPTYTDDIAPLLAAYCVDCHAHDAVMYAGVELDSYAAARSVRVKNTCTAISPDLIDEFADWLIPQDGHSGEPACAPWESYSMPPGAMTRLTPDQQRMLAVWVALGAPE